MITLTTHRRWRGLTLLFLYAAQGAPEGLLYVALPAWLAANGVEVAAIGSYLAIILLPWGFKLLNGILMDRFTIRAMGRRRPWILGAQTTLVLSLLILAAGSVNQPDLFFLSCAGFAINLAAAFQDVAIDGMAIDLIPEGERGEANGIMWGGKTLGLAASSALSGAIIAWSGPAAAALAIATFVSICMAFPLLLRERPGERLLPWSEGTAAASTPSTPPRLLQILWTLVQALAKPAPTLFSLGILAAFTAYGLKTAFAPTLAVQQLGWAQEDFGYLAGAANLAGGGFGILASGFLTDRIGSLRTIIASLVLMAALHASMAAASSQWGTPFVFAGYYVLHALVFVLLSVSVYSRAMALARVDIAATHFATFMAFLNLGTALGAQQLGWMQARWDYQGTFLAAAGCCVIAILLFAASNRQLDRP